MKVIGSYKSMERANEALSKLKTAGYTDSYIEIDNNNMNIKRNLINSNSGYGLSKLVIDPNDMQQHPLTSISPLINVTGGFTEFNDKNYKLHVESDKNSITRAKNLIKSLGGKIEVEHLDIGRVHEGIRELNEKFKDNGI